MTTVCLEFGVGAHVDDATLAWIYDLRWWGLFGQGTDEASALEDFTARAHPSYARFPERHGEIARPLRGFEVVERIHGDERTFHRDHEPATDEELQRTVALLAYAREELLALSLKADATTKFLNLTPDRIDAIDLSFRPSAQDR